LFRGTTFFTLRSGNMTMKKMSVQARALHRAAAAVGGLHALAGYLRISDEHIREWMFDVGAPPNGVFLRVVDLLLDDPDHLASDGVSVLSDTNANMTRL
jgi:hypothetical protein